MKRKLACGCITDPSPATPPTHERNGFRSPEPQIRRYMKTHTCEIEDSTTFRLSVLRTKQWLKKVFSPTRVYHPLDILDDLSKPTSPGEYFKQKGFKTKKDVINSEKGRNLLRTGIAYMKKGAIKADRYRTLVVVADASSPIDDPSDIKTRVAWVYPLVISAVENMFAYGFKTQLPNDWVPTPRTHHSKYCGRKSRSMDFSKFDSSIHRKLISIAFDLLTEMLIMDGYYVGSDGERYGIYKPNEILRLWNFIRYYFIYTPFYTVENPTTRVKAHGVPSGSQFTNLIDTIISKLVTEYIHQNECRVTTYGDDVHVAACAHTEQFIECAATKLGLKVKVEYPNIHGCLTYCKVQCHLGHPFRPGIWFSNVLNKARKKYKKMVLECLLYMQPTYDQKQWLLEQIAKCKGIVGRVHDRLKLWLDKMFEYVIHKTDKTWVNPL